MWQCWDGCLRRRSGAAQTSRIHAVRAREEALACPPLSLRSGVEPSPWSPAHGNCCPHGLPFPKLLCPTTLGLLRRDLAPALSRFAVPQGCLALPSSFCWPWILHVPETTHIPHFAKNSKSCLRHLAGWLGAVTGYFGAARGCVQQRNHSLCARRLMAPTLDIASGPGQASSLLCCSPAKSAYRPCACPCCHPKGTCVRCTVVVSTEEPASNEKQ